MMLMKKTSATTLVLPHCQWGKEVIRSKCPRRGCHIVLGGGGDDLHRGDEDMTMMMMTMIVKLIDILIMNDNVIL